MMFEVQMPNEWHLQRGYLLKTNTELRKNDLPDKAYEK
jgi:hypothetical protein